MKMIIIYGIALSLSLLQAEERKSPTNSTPDFQASVDKLNGHQYQSYREPVTVITKSGRIVVGVHAGNRLSWPERSGQDLVIRYTDDQGKT